MKKIEFYREIVSKIKYKNNFSMSINHLPSTPGYEFRIWMKVPDRDTGIETPLLMREWIYNHDFDEAEFVHLIYHNIRKMEMHEVDEFFMYDNKRMFDPHIQGPKS